MMALMQMNCPSHAACFAANPPTSIPSPSPSPTPHTHKRHAHRDSEPRLRACAESSSAREEGKCCAREPLMRSSTECPPQARSHLVSFRLSVTLACPARLGPARLATRVFTSPKLHHSSSRQLAASLLTPAGRLASHAAGRLASRVPIFLWSCGSEAYRSRGKHLYSFWYINSCDARPMTRGGPRAPAAASAG